MATYIYTGASPLGFSFEDQPYLLTEGDTISLETTNAFIDGLISQGLLVLTRDQAENFVAEGRTLNYVVPSGQSVAAGALVAIGNIVGVAQTEGAAGETVVLSLDGIWEFNAAVAITAGDRVFRASGTSVNKTDSAPFVGVAIANSAAGKVRVRVISSGDGGAGGGPEQPEIILLLSSLSTSTPTLTVLKNTIGGTITIFKGGAGLYQIDTSTDFAVGPETGRLFITIGAFNQLVTAGPNVAGVSSFNVFPATKFGEPSSSNYGRIPMQCANLTPTEASYADPVGEIIVSIKPYLFP